MTDHLATRGEFSRQADIARTLGSPFVAAVLEAGERHLGQAPRTAALIRSWPGDPSAAALAMRFNAAIHALARRGRPQRLESLYRRQHAWGDPRIDGAASIAIGCILAAVAILLAREAKGLLIGERANPEVIECVRAILSSKPEIVRVNHVRTIHTAPDRIFVAVSADFEDHITMGAGETLIEAIEHELKAALPMLSSIYIRPEKAEDAPEAVAVG